MSISQNLMAAGGWSLRLRPDTPQRILDKIGYFSHVAVTEAPEDIRLAGDAVLSSALYVGVLRGTAKDEGGTEISGAGMAIWLGDEDDKGAVYETPQVFTGATFTSTITTLLAGSAIQAGTLHSVTGTYTGTHQYQSPRKAIDYVTSTMDAEWRVNGDGTLDAGTVDDLYPTPPRAAIIAKARGTSSRIKALPGAAKLAADTKDFTTRVVLLATTTEDAVATGSADIAVNPYLDIHGQPVKFTRLVSESTTSTGNADARAQLQLNRFTNPRDSVTLNSTTHDVAGSLAVGEKVWVYDPDAGLYDLANEVQWQGETLNAALLRVTSLTWPVERGRGVYLRTQTGEWLDLTGFVTYESGQTNVTVGGYHRSLVSTGSESVPVRLSAVPKPDTTVPNAPAWVGVPTGRTYQSPLTGTTRARIALDWTQPTNDDSTAIIDGDHYEVRYRTTTRTVTPATHAQMAGYTHDALDTHDSPIPIVTGEWEYRMAPWDVSNTVVQELEPGTTYEFQVRGVDNATPPNYGPWSTAELVTTTGDDIAPETPAAPTATGNPVSVQVVHKLGKAGGGDFTLDPDLHHLEIHLDYEPTFEPRPTAIDVGGTFAGNVTATHAEINGQIPVVRTVTVAATGVLYCKVVAVDNAGNRSRPSGAAAVTPGFVLDQHIGSLTVSKLISGTVSAQIVLAGRIGTAPVGATGVRRATMDGTNGFYTYNELDQLTFWAGSNGQVFARGQFVTGASGEKRIELDPVAQALTFYPVAGSVQRFALTTFEDDPSQDDPAQTPGAVLQGINSLDRAEGARLTLAEDKASIFLANEDVSGAYLGTHTGGFFTATRDFGKVGFTDATGAQVGYTFKFYNGSYLLDSHATGGAGSYHFGAATDSWWGIRQSDASFRTYIRQNTASTIGEIQLRPQGNAASTGYIAFYQAFDATQSARIKMMTGNGFGAMFKSVNTGGGTNIECRRHDDASGATIYADAHLNFSDENTKTDIRDAEPGALGKIRKHKAKKWKRQKYILDEPREEDWEDVVGAEGTVTRELKSGVAERLARDATDGPEHLGFIAQDVPAELQADSSAGLAVNLSATVAMLWQGTQELAEENDGLRSRVDALEAQVAALTAAVEKLTKAKG